MQAQIETPRTYSGLGTKAARSRTLVVRASLLDMPGRERMREKAQAMGGLGVAGMGAAAAKGGFNGNFSSLFTGVLQFVQTDRGFAYDGTPLATAGNTSATVMTLAGTISGAVVPVLVKATNTATVGSGATFSIYYDGGTTPAMTGVALNATPTALTGAGAGLTLAASVASSVTNDTWKARCASLADQSGNGLHYTQGTASKRPVITVGLNGHAGLLFDGATQCLTSTLNLPAPGTTPTYIFLIARQLAWTGNVELVSCINFAVGQQIKMGGSTNASPNLCATSGTANATCPTSAALPLNTWGCIEAYFTNSTSSFLRAGTDTDHTLAAEGNNGSTGRAIALGESAQCANMELLAVGYMNNLPGNRAAARAAATAFYAGGVAV